VARPGRPGELSEAGKKKELWKRWRSGESISDIARALKKPAGSIHAMIEAIGAFLHHGDAGEDARALWSSGRRSPAGLLRGSLCVRSQTGWGGLLLLSVGIPLVYSSGTLPTSGGWVVGLPPGEQRNVDAPATYQPHPRRYSPCR